jgi:hypothetical protein
MNFDRYAGMASAVGIVLILMIVTWLDLWGPINVGVIKEWQTLVGAGVTLLAAVVAYFAAMKHLSFDRQTLEREASRRRLGVLFRTHLVLKELRDRAEAAGNYLSKVELGASPVSRADILIREPSDFGVIWDDLDTLPTELIAGLVKIRSMTREFNKRASAHAESRELFKDLEADAWLLASRSSEAEKMLEPLITELVPHRYEPGISLRRYGPKKR